MNFEPKNQIAVLDLFAPHFAGDLRAEVVRGLGSDGAVYHKVSVNVLADKTEAKGVQFPDVELGAPANVKLTFAPVDIPSGNQTLTFAASYAQLGDTVKVMFERMATEPMKGTA